MRDSRVFIKAALLSSLGGFRTATVILPDRVVAHFRSRFIPICDDECQLLTGFSNYWTAGSLVSTTLTNTTDHHSEVEADSLARN
jgi:hypothetical protein